MCKVAILALLGLFTLGASVGCEADLDDDGAQIEIGDK